LFPRTEVRHLDPIMPAARDYTHTVSGLGLGPVQRAWAKFLTNFLRGSRRRYDRAQPLKTHAAAALTAVLRHETNRAYRSVLFAPSCERGAREAKAQETESRRFRYGRSTGKGAHRGLRDRRTQQRNCPNRHSDSAIFHFRIVHNSAPVIILTSMISRCSCKRGPLRASVTFAMHGSCRADACRMFSAS
jgi:hypothetical protein